jgi:hypothetical protein
MNIFFNRYLVFVLFFHSISFLELRSINYLEKTVNGITTYYKDNSVISKEDYVMAMAQLYSAGTSAFPSPMIPLFLPDAQNRAAKARVIEAGIIAGSVVAGTAALGGLAYAYHKWGQGKALPSWYRTLRRSMIDLSKNVGLPFPVLSEMEKKTISVCYRSFAQGYFSRKSKRNRFNNYVAHNLPKYDINEEIPDPDFPGNRLTLTTFGNLYDSTRRDPKDTAISRRLISRQV